MSQFVRFEPSGLYALRWDGDVRKYRRRRAKRSSILAKLRVECKIAAGTTLGDIFHAVASYPILVGFVAEYSWCSQILEFHAQADEPIRSEDSCPKLDYLEVYRTAHVQKYKKKNHLGIGVGFQGVGDPKEGIDPLFLTPEGKVLYSVSCSPAYDLADLPVKLNESFSIWGSYEDKPLAPIVPDARMGYSLLEVLDAIYDDISFHGGPAENAEFIDRMRETMDKIDSGEIERLVMDLDPEEPAADA